MKDLFLKRKQAFRKECVGYLRYVLNDHFVLFLLVLIGFLAYQYSQLLQDFPYNHWPILLFLGIVSALLLAWGGIATYMEGPDKLFLLVSEEEVKSYLKGQSSRSFVFWTIVQTLFLLLFAPLFLAMGYGLPVFLVYVLLLGVAKYLLFRQKASKFFTETGLDWDYVIAQESKRKQILLRFFALFTQVKGVSNSVKRRAYLDFILKAVQKVPSKIWQNLYLRSYLRNGDLFALSLRLLFLSLLALVFIEQAWIATAVVVLFNYLMLFQLLALYRAFDYQYLTQLFPLEKGEKEKGLQEVIRGLTGFVLLVQLIVGLITLQEKLALLALLGAGLVLQILYLPYRVKHQMQD
ncbi:MULTISPECIES: ABC transporter permease [Streptococcus]|mgnify:FL=1|uniref:Multidrug ABC transporter permease n=2 Tax=Streptococcus TaxID=1301 RepID=A0A1L8Q340_STROR|nr:MULTISPECIES: ABC transporter permease [Streptococcus]AQA08625.1 bacterial ABC transporter EcsB family protein [Streptococcus oralis]MBN6011815.1 ABC transporter permease [Streptococcus oralis subsp. oralis]MDY4365693.1 ABC transporter permease [Streptococcus sp. 21WXBC0044M1]OJG01946.1 multidrug ABC transporter permease [Streptococcus oralis]